MRNKIRMVKVYQGILIDGSTLTSFTPDEFLSDAGMRKGRTAEIVENGVLIKGLDMSVLVPWNNVAYVQLIESEVPKIAKVK